MLTDRARRIVKSAIRTILIDAVCESRRPGDGFERWVRQFANEPGWVKLEVVTWLAALD